ncbi:hypothetical protein QA089_005100 [Meyerozyma guilliermondii]
MFRTANPFSGGLRPHNVNSGTVLAIRTLKRRPAYPQTYQPQLADKTHPTKDHSSFFQRHLKAWLGPRNVRGEYYRNKYYYPPQNHKPNYIVPDGNTVVDPSKPETNNDRRMGNTRRDPSLQPFPQNPYCKTALMISNELKDTIYQQVQQGAHIQEIAHKYGIKLERVEAIVRLQEIERGWKKENKISQDMEKFASVMYKMFPLFEPPVDAENLTEIPTPQRTLHQRFLTISESEPFGPVDAAEIFGLEPAQQTLDNLTEFKDTTANSNTRTNEVLIGKQKQGDSAVFKFTHAQSGNVGFRYGASRRDRKKDRAIGFDKAGKMVNMV